MKRYLYRVLAVISFLLLMSCASKLRSTSPNVDLTREAWMQEVDTKPNKWMRGADNWFLTGDPNATERSMRNAPYPAIISTLKVRVSNFSKIKVNGNFQVQIVGTYGNNTVYVYGPNDLVRQTVVELRGDTLCLDQIKKASPQIRNVIIRVGINQFSGLIQLGRGNIEGIQLKSRGLAVFSKGSGNMYLAGDMNLKQLINVGPGRVNIFGANTPELDIRTSGTGMTNVSGNVGVRSIVHRGKADINIIGANTNFLRIFASGKGKVGIYGIVNLREVRAQDHTRVYVYQLASSDLYAYAYGNARIGLAGAAHNIYIDAFKNACVGGRNLCTQTAYVRVHDKAHVNLYSANKVFASATENSSIYLFGAPNMLSQFVSGTATIIPIWSTLPPYCPMAAPAVVRPPSKIQAIKPIRPIKPVPFKARHLRGEG